ncbi:MAG: hypothetical protein ACXVAM_11970 [Vulcanimicrobiaceae bacterium]
MQSRRTLAVAIQAAVLGIAFGTSTLCAVQAASPDPCAYLSKVELSRVMGWTVTGVARKRYELPRGSGAICGYDAKEGSAVITVPDGGGNAFLGTSPVTDPESNGEAIQIKGLPAYAYAWNGAVFIYGLHGGRAVSIKIVPNNDPVTLEQLTAIARVVSPRLKNPR